MQEGKLNILSLCSGGGGLDLGVKLACPSAVTVCCVEHEAYCCEVLAARMEDEALDDAPVWTDLRTFDGKPWRGIVDGVIGGIPCPPWSVAGKRAGTLDDRDLWPDTARIIGEVQPGFVFIENVPGIAVLDGLGRMARDLHDMGFEIAAGFFSAEEVGASHKRERLFILAYRTGGGCEREASAASQEDRQANAQRNAGQLQGRLGGPCCDVADAPAARRRGNEPQRGEDRGAASGRAGAAVEDSTRHGQPGRGGQGGGRGRRGVCEAGQPLFPPGPADLDAWRQVLEIDPTLEPALDNAPHGKHKGQQAAVGAGEQRERRDSGSGDDRQAPLEPALRGMADELADGLDPMANRTERLRMLGNGVVPLQAAYALCALAACLITD